MDIAGIINGHMPLYPHFFKNISQFPIGTEDLDACGVEFYLDHICLVDEPVDLLVPYDVQRQL